MHKNEKGVAAVPGRNALESVHAARQGHKPFSPADCSLQAVPLMRGEHVGPDGTIITSQLWSDGSVRFLGARRRVRIGGRLCWRACSVPAARAAAIRASLSEAQRFVLHRSFGVGEL
jgi:hypothetical protein